jgi:hypothetical protein
MAGYYQALHATAATVDSVAKFYSGSIPPFYSAISAQVATYIQQNVTPTWPYYWMIGVAIAIVGAIIVVIGDRKSPKTEEQAPLQLQPIPVKRQE